MEMLRYEETVEQIIGNESVFEYLGEGDMMSPLIPARIHGEKGHGFLCFSQTEEGWTAENALVMPEPAEGAVILKENPGTEISLTEPEEETGKKYITLYPQVFQFVFSETLSSEQKEILKEYGEVTKSFFGEVLYQLLRNVFPDIFVWMDETLK